jgi:hypothetical protein
MDGKKQVKLNVYAMITANQKNDLYLKKEFTKQIIVCVHSRCTAMVHWVRVAHAQTIFG